MHDSKNLAYTAVVSLLIVAGLLWAWGVGAALAAVVASIIVMVGIGVSKG